MERHRAVAAIAGPGRFPQLGHFVEQVADTIAPDGTAEFADIANGIFQLVTSIMLVVFAIKAWKGKPVHIESIEDLTNWFDEKIDSKLLGNK